jgi:pimeloyl-ACP methyl ester carboxylesterase
MKRATLADETAVPWLDELVPPWPGRAVELDGSVTFVRDTPATSPDAEPAVYVHGLGGSSQNWTDLAALLTDYLDGQAIDLPGFGRSDPNDRYTLAAMSDRVVRWIEFSDRGPVHLLGNSLGGTIAVKVAAAHPDLVRSLTLVSPALPFLNPRRTLQGRLLPLLAVPRAKYLANRLLSGYTPEQLAQQVIEAVFADPKRVAKQRLAEAIEEVRLRYTVDHYVDAYLGTMRGLVASFLRAYLPGSGSLWKVLSTVGAPSLVIGGRQDRLVDVRVAPQAAKLIPDSRLMMLDGVGHVAQMEVPRLVARAVVALLDEVAGRPPTPAADRRWRLPDV